MLNARRYSDGVIVKEVLKGNRDRFDGLVERHLPAVYATALAHTRNSADAEDVVQDTFLSAFTALDKLRSPGRFGPWVITIARNTSLKHLRRKRMTDNTAEEAPDGESPISSAQRKEFGVFLSEAIAELPEGDREAILLHYFSGKSAREVAHALGVSRAAVLKRLERGRARLGKSLLDRLGDEQTVREALSPSIHRVTRVIAVAAVAWETSKSITAGSVFAASLSVLPKASTVAAGLAGVGFTVVVGWNYLKSDGVEHVEAVPEPLTPSSVVVAVQSSEDAPETIAVPAASVQQEPGFLLAAQTESTTETEIVATTTSDEPESTTSKEATDLYATIDGFWDFTLEQDGVDMGDFGRVELSGAGGGLHVLSVEGSTLDFIRSVVRTGRHVEIALEDADFNSGTLVGDFNEALTELILDGVSHTNLEGEWVEISLRMVGTRVSADDFSREDKIEAFKLTLFDLFGILKVYAGDHNGQYPEELGALYPRYVSDEATILSNATRSLIYRRPPSLGFEEDIQVAIEEALAETDPGALMDIEYYLQDLWGQFYLKKVPVLESMHQVLDVRVQVSDAGKITEVKSTADAESGGTVSNTMARSLNASCMNNMKQMGIACKMFTNTQVVNLMPPGLRTLYPNYIIDVRILTCPGTKPGTESYELLFPATNVAYIQKLGRQVEGLSADADEALLQSKVPFALELQDCNGLGGRNILYLDGHVTLHEDGEWESIVEPYWQR